MGELRDEANAIFDREPDVAAVVQRKADGSIRVLGRRHGMEPPSGLVKVLDEFTPSGRAASQGVSTESQAEGQASRRDTSPPTEPPRARPG